RSPIRMVVDRQSEWLSTANYVGEQKSGVRGRHP
ncbi:MAG: hypothetical protein ACI814_004838, partial [Mariniblastus sp.]